MKATELIGSSNTVIKLMSTTPTTHAAACHCRAVQFNVRLSDEFNSIRRCTCSYCRMRGAVAVSAELDGIEFTRGRENLSLYQFKTQSARHYFCSTCGIYTHHQRRSNPRQYGINVACIENVSPFDFKEVIVTDGVNHPSDSRQQVRVAGILRFSENESIE